MSRRASATVLGLLLVSLITGLSSIAGATGSNAGPASAPAGPGPPPGRAGATRGTVTPPTTASTRHRPPLAAARLRFQRRLKLGQSPRGTGQPPTPAPDPTPAPSPGRAVARSRAGRRRPRDCGRRSGSGRHGGRRHGSGRPGCSAPATPPTRSPWPRPRPTTPLSLPPIVAGTLDDSTPRTAAESLVARAPQSIAAVAALVLAIIVFLAFHRRPDRHDRAGSRRRTASRTSPRFR